MKTKSDKGLCELCFRRFDRDKLIIDVFASVCQSCWDDAGDSK